MVVFLTKTLVALYYVARILKIEKRKKKSSSINYRQASVENKYLKLIDEI